MTLSEQLNCLICELIGIYRTIRHMSLISGHDFIGNNAYGELKCKRCGYVSKGDPRFYRGKK